MIIGSANTNASREYTRWVERAFSRRECVRFVPSGKDTTKCGCGHPWTHHKTHGVESPEQNVREVWYVIQYKLKNFLLLQNIFVFK